MNILFERNFFSYAIHLWHKFELFLVILGSGQYNFTRFPFFIYPLTTLITHASGWKYRQTKDVSMRWSKFPIPGLVLWVQCNCRKHVGRSRFIRRRMREKCPSYHISLASFIVNIWTMLVGFKSIVTKNQLIWILNTY